MILQRCRVEVVINQGSTPIKITHFQLCGLHFLFIREIHHRQDKVHQVEGTEENCGYKVQGIP